MSATKAEMAYHELIVHRKELALLSSTASLLGWDQRTYMPRHGGSHRSAQLAQLSGMLHRQATDPRIADWLHLVEGSALVADPTCDAAVNVREIRRQYNRSIKLPVTLVQEKTRINSAAYMAWVDARSRNDFKAFLPHLEQAVRIQREIADAYGWEGTRYNALLEGFEPGMTYAALVRIFEPLRKELVVLIERLAASGREPRMDFLNNYYPIPAQEAFCLQGASTIGFELDGGRLDVTTHPFCSTIGPGDTRLTTRYREHAFTDAYFGTLHEAGHGLYGQGLDPEHFGTPLGSSVSLGIHESQSRLWENFVGRSLAYWRFMYPEAQKAFPSALGSVTLDEFYFAINRSQRSYIRVESDESTYNLHILLRFELETALVEDRLQPADLPGAWNETFKNYLGLEVNNDREGCLQDVHWSQGGYGYFPTYTLGNLYAAQFCEQAAQELGNLDEQFARGEFQPLLNWLRAKIHRQGMRYGAGELCAKITGQSLSHHAMMRHLQRKLEPLYYG